MRIAATKWAVTGKCQTIRTDRAPGLDECCGHVLFGVVRVDRADASAFFVQIIEKFVQQIGGCFLVAGSLVASSFG